MSFPNGDIKLSNNFELNASSPLDARNKVNTITDRDNIDFKYEGLSVYVVETKKSYTCINPTGSGTWEIGGSGDTFSGVTQTQFINYSGLTDTKINNKLNISVFNPFSSTTDNRLTKIESFYVSLTGTSSTNISGNLQFENSKGLTSFQSTNEATVKFGNQTNETLDIYSKNLNDNSIVGISLLGDDFLTGMNIYGSGIQPVNINTESGSINITSVNGNIGINSSDITIGNATNNNLNFKGLSNSIVNFDQKTIILNKSSFVSPTNDGGNVGMSIEEKSGSTVSIKGFFKTTPDRTGWSIKAPGSNGIVNLINPTTNYNILFPNKISGSTETFAMISDVSSFSSGISQSMFVNYTSNTNTQINNKLDLTTFANYTATTQSGGNGSGVTYSDFYNYTAVTNTKINTKLNISDFNIYSSNTLSNNNNSLNTKLDKTTFANYTATTQSSSGGSQTFTADIVVSLSGGRTAGKYTNGQTIPLIGKTPQQAFNDMFVEYINPNFGSFSVGQASQVEVGTTISGSKTFSWGINANSGVVPTIDLFDVTAGSTLLAGTPNDGSQSQTVTTIQLNSQFAQQSWRGVGNNTSPTSTFNSGNFTVTAYFILFQGPTSSNPSNSAQVRALGASQFYGGGTTFTLNTGTVERRFAVALPPGVTITQVIDIDSLGDNITSNYVLVGIIGVLDAGGTNRLYNLYVMTNAITYETNHRHSVSVS